MTNLLARVANQAMQNNPTDKQVLAQVSQARTVLGPAVVKPTGNWNGDPDFLVKLVEENPKRLPQLIGSRSIHSDLVDTLLNVQHRPTAQIAERVAAHSQLSRTGIDYIIAHGTKRALDRLLDNHFGSLTTDDMVTISARFAKTGGGLIKVTEGPIWTEWTRLDGPDPKWSALLEAQLDILTTLPAEKINDSTEVMELLESVVNAGLKVPAAVRKLARVPRLNAVKTFGTFNFGSDYFILLNPKLEALLKTAAPSLQSDFVSFCPMWSVVAKCTDPAQVTDDSNTLWRLGDEGFTPDLACKFAADWVCLRHPTEALQAIHARLGDENDHWTALEGILDTWGGTLGDLLDTVTAL